MKVLLDTVNNRVIPYPRIDDEPVVGLDTIYRPMDVIQDDCPEYDRDFDELVETEVIDIINLQVHRGYIVNVDKFRPTEEQPSEESILLQVKSLLESGDADGALQLLSDITSLP